MENLVIIQEGRPITNSLLVAERFGKKHFHVLDAVKNLLSSHEKTGECYISATYVDSSGKENPMYIMNRDGFSLLVMGFTGKDALNFKFEFIEAFNQMEKLIQNGISMRVAAVEENIRRRYLLTKEMQDVNAQIAALMKRHETIKKEMHAIDTEDFAQLSLFPRYEAYQIKHRFPNRGKSLKHHN
ncbi:MAG: Rha family transcriptional regulator [Tannerellaceae bacterium]|jgi:Rha family phage regulatory protein|nr:Rha family transcriptional regulator [Tannerellaceae bacterium]